MPINGTAPKGPKPRPSPPPPKTFNVLVSASGTREQLAEALTRLAGSVRFSERASWGHTAYGTGELDVYAGEHPRVSNAAVLRAAESGLLDAIDPDRPAYEEAMRGEGETHGEF